MELSLALCEEITGLGKMPAPADEAEYERRRTQRFAFGSRATICTLRKGVESDKSVVLMRDISLSGIGFLHAEPLKLGTTFNISFCGRRGREIKIQCEVDRCDVGGTGGTQYVIGGTFESVLAPAHDDDLPGEEEPAQPPPLMASLRSRPGFSSEPRRPSRIFIPYERVADDETVKKMNAPEPVSAKVASAPVAFKETLLPPLESASAAPHQARPIEPPPPAQHQPAAAHASKLFTHDPEPEEEAHEENELRRALRERSATHELPPLPVEESTTEIPVPEPLAEPVEEEAEFTILDNEVPAEGEVSEEHTTHVLPPVEQAITSDPVAEDNATIDSAATTAQATEAVQIVDDPDAFSIIETDLAGQSEAPSPAPSEAKVTVERQEPSAMQKKVEDAVPSAGVSSPPSPIMDLPELTKLKEHSAALVAVSLKIEQELSTMAEDVFTVLQDSPSSNGDESTPHSANKNLEVVSKLKNFLHSQNRTLQGQIQQLHENNKQLRDANQRLATHSQAMSEVTQKRNELQLKLTQTEQELSDERSKAEKELSRAERQLADERTEAEQKLSQEKSKAEQQLTHEKAKAEQQISQEKAKAEKLISEERTKAEQALAEERTAATQQAELHQSELAQLREMVKTLQAKSDADDKAIAELAAFLQNESTPGAAGDHPDGTQTIAA